MPELSEHRWSELIPLAQGGSADAVAELLQSVRTYLLLIANQELSPQFQAKVAPSDLVQDVLFRAKENLGAFRGDSRQELLAWLRKSLLHEIIDIERRFRGVKRNVDREVAFRSDAENQGNEPRPASPLSKLVRIEEAISLRTAVEALAPHYRDVIYLRNWKQLKFREVGQQLGKSEEATKKLWRRAIVQLKNELKELRDGQTSE